MSAINFPDSPSDGQEFSAAGRRWRYDEAKNAWSGISVAEGGSSVVDPIIRTASEGAPEDDTFATLELGTGEAGTLYTAITRGSAGHLVTITHAAASALAVEAACTVVGTAITVTPAAKGRMNMTGGPPGTVGEILILEDTDYWSNTGTVVNPLTSEGVFIYGSPGSWRFIVNVAGTPAYDYTSASEEVTPDLIPGGSWSSPGVTASALASTAAQNQAAVNADEDASALVTAAPLDGYTGTSVAATASATALAGGIGTTPESLSQFCIVGDAEGPFDIYVCSQLSPAMWLQLDSVALTQAALQAAISDPDTFIDFLGAGFRNVPLNSKSVDYTTVLADAGKCVPHPTTDGTPRSFTIDSHANVPYPLGTVLMFANDTGGGDITIAITADTMTLAPSGETGSRTLTAPGLATAIKLTNTRWMISGAGLT